MPLDTARRICSDQLAPFDGLCSYSKDMDQYQGTLFRMPLKILSPISKGVDVPQVDRLLREYVDVGRESLLFLKHVKNIRFSLRDAAQPLWSISAERPESFEDEVFQQIKVSGSRKGRLSFEELWRVGLTDIERAPTHIFNPQGRARKITECGIAACLRRENIMQDVASDRQEKSKMKFYCKLPSRYLSELPVSVHASFSITGDRRSISVEDDKDPNTAWNCWLLSDCIPGFYIEFLKDLAPRNGISAFNFWPSTSLGSNPLSRLVCNSFWSKIRESKYSHYPLYPLVEAVLLPSRSASLTTRTSGRRKLHEVTALNSAEFDIFPEKKSSTLRPLLCSWCPRLVRPPFRLSRHLVTEASSPIIILDAPYLCQLLKVERNCAYLEEFLLGLDEEDARVKALEMLLLEIIPESVSVDNTHLEALDGCRVLPFRNGSLKHLKSINHSESRADWAILPTEEEQEVFDFAQDFFIDFRLFDENKNPKADDVSDGLVGMHRNPIKQLKDASFNIRTMQLNDIGKTLTRSDSPLASPEQSPPDDIWFSRFWNYMNKKVLEVEQQVEQQSPDYMTTVNEFLVKCGVQRCRIYRVRAGDAWQYITPEEFQVDSCIVKPANWKQAQLCDEIKGLRLVERSGVPYPMVIAESNLDDAPSMSRFLRALQAIEKRIRRPIKASLQSQLSTQSIQLLRDLIMGTLSGSLIWRDIPVLQELPIWPRQDKNVTSSLGPNLAAKDAIFCKSTALLTPWTHGYNKFIDPGFVKENQSTLSAIGFQVEEARQVWTDRIERFLPTKLGSDLFDQ